MSRRRRFNLPQAMALFTILILCSIITSMALTQYTAPTQYTEMWGGSEEDSSFQVTDLNVKIKGHNKLEVHIELTNADSETHSTNSTVMLLDSSGDLVTGMEQYDLSGDVLASATHSFVIIFQATDITSTYNSVLVQIDDID